MLTARPPLELHLDARPELAATLRRQLSDRLEARQCHEKGRLRGDAGDHGGLRKRRPASTPAARTMVDLRVSITDSSLCVSLRDHGVCDGRQAGEAHGLGLPMMRLLMDGVEVQTGADITTVTMRRALSLH